MSVLRNRRIAAIVAAIGFAVLFVFQVCSSLPECRWAGDKDDTAV